MNNIIDYVKWRSDLSFNERSLNLADALIFTQLLYLDLFDNIISSYPSKSLHRLEDVFDEIFKEKSIDDINVGLILPHDIVVLAHKIKNTKRFSNVYVSNNINLIDKENMCQFSALCFHINEEDILVAFSGTDDTLVGWQENLHMLNTFPIPSQNLAKKYIDKIIRLFPNSNIYIAGHSKGGNLAAYSAIYSEMASKEKIKEVYCFDSPGFKKSTINIEKFELVKDKIKLIIPKSAVVGLAFTPFAGETIICDSSYKGLKQHDAFSWIIEQTDFIRLDKITDEACKFDQYVKVLLNKLTEEQINELAHNIYSFVIELNKNTLSEVQKDYIRFIKLTNKITPYNRKLFMSLIVNLLKYKML